MNQRKYPFIRTATTDSLLEDNAKSVAGLQGSNSTEEEQEALKDLRDGVEDDISYIHDVQEELLEYMEARGCNVWDYIKP